MELAISDDNVRSCTPSQVVTEKQERAALLLANGSTMEEAAKATGQHIQTIKLWKTKSYFCQAVREFRRQLTEQTLGLMVKYQVDAVRELHRLMTTSRMEPVRLGAAKALLENTRAMQEMSELQEEIADLKRVLSERYSGVAA